MIIDCHTHIFSPQVKNDRDRYIKVDACFAELYSSPKAKMVTANELVASMDEEEVDVSVVLNIGWTTPEMCVESNDYIMEAVARFPKRLVGFGMVQPRKWDTALSEIERCARGGLKGIGELRPDVQGIDLRDGPSLKPLVQTLAKHNMILITHASEPVGHQYPGKGTVMPDVLYSFITNFPDLKLVCAHWGGGLPFYALMPEVKQSLNNVWFDTAASPFLYSQQIYQQVISVLGADRILLGSDYPLMKPSRLLKEIRALGLPAETEQMILSGNAQKLLNIEAK